MLDSLVRVSRRVNENRSSASSSVLSGETPTASGTDAHARRALLCGRAAAPGPRGPSWAHADAPCGSPRSPPRWASPGAVTGTGTKPAPHLPRGLLPPQQPMLTGPAARTRRPPSRRGAVRSWGTRTTPRLAGGRRSVCRGSLVVAIASFLAISSTV